MIPSLLVNDKIISKFSEKTNLFNKFFTSQCTHLENNSFLRPFCLKTRKSLSSLEISETDIFAIIKNLDPNKSHGWDIKLCGKSITYPFNYIWSIVTRGNISKLLQKREVVPVHKMQDKNLLKNYRPTLKSWIIVPPRLLIFWFFSTQDIFIPTPLPPSPIINFQSFLLTFLSLWNPIVSMSIVKYM